MPRKRVERNIYFDDTRNKYYVNLDFGIDPDTGKQVKKTQTFAKLTQARAALRKHETDRDAGQTVLPNDLTLSQLLTTWMNDKHISPTIGSIPLQKLTPQQLQRYYADKIREGTISSNTVRKHHDLLNAALRVAVKQWLILVNPASRVAPPKVKRPDIHFYSLEELQTILQLSEGTRLEVLIKLAGLLGLRREEIVGLTWDHVDFEHKNPPPPDRRSIPIPSASLCSASPLDKGSRPFSRGPEVSDS